MRIYSYISFLSEVTILLSDNSFYAIISCAVLNKNVSEVYLNESSWGYNVICIAFNSL